MPIILGPFMTNFIWSLISCLSLFIQFTVNFSGTYEITLTTKTSLNCLLLGQRAMFNLKNSVSIADRNLGGI